jgi:hypothetical protein
MPNNTSTGCQTIACPSSGREACVSRSRLRVPVVWLLLLAPSATHADPGTRSQSLIKKARNATLGRLKMVEMKRQLKVDELTEGQRVE